MVSFQPIEFPRRFRVILCILPSNGKTHGMPPTHITADHLLVRDILPNLLLQLRLDLELLQSVGLDARVASSAQHEPGLLVLRLTLYARGAELCGEFLVCFGGGDKVRRRGGVAGW